jgi:hypothetical protein
MSILEMAINQETNVLKMSLQIEDDIKSFCLSALKEGPLIPSIQIPSELFDIVNTGEICRIQRLVNAINDFCEGEMFNFPIDLDVPINWEEYHRLHKE